MPSICRSRRREYYALSIVVLAAASASWFVMLPVMGVAGLLVRLVWFASIDHGSFYQEALARPGAGVDGLFRCLQRRPPPPQARRSPPLPTLAPRPPPFPPCP